AFEAYAPSVNGVTAFSTVSLPSRANALSVKLPAVLAGANLSLGADTPSVRSEKGTDMTSRAKELLSSISRSQLQTRTPDSSPSLIPVSPERRPSQHLANDCSDANVPLVAETLTVYDGNAYFYCMKDIPADFRQIGFKVFDMIGKTGNVVLSTDQYLPGSIKSMERRRRGCGEKLILTGEASKRPPDWK
ncbi:hypothetical protein SNEBB_005570, partial [Seison nebaliae]